MIAYKIFLLAHLYAYTMLKRIRYDKRLCTRLSYL